MPRTILSTTDIGGISAELKGDSQDVTRQKYASEAAAKALDRLRYRQEYQSAKPEVRAQMEKDAEDKARAEFVKAPPKADSTASTAAPATKVTAQEQRARDQDALPIFTRELAKAEAEAAAGNPRAAPDGAAIKREMVKRGLAIPAAPTAAPAAKALPISQAPKNGVDGKFVPGKGTEVFVDGKLAGYKN